VGTYQKNRKNRNYGNISIFKNSELWELFLKIGIMGTYLYFDNSELWEHIQSELWHLSFGIMGSFHRFHQFYDMGGDLGTLSNYFFENLIFKPAIASVADLKL
jgi:hypothetical protein